MSGTQLLRFKTISEYHKYMNLPKPEHPLVSVLNFEDILKQRPNDSINFVYEFYAISLKKDFAGKVKYGQQ